MIKLFLYPNKGVGDYHLALLEQSLANEDIDVHFPQSIKFANIFPIYRQARRSKVKIFHTHWIHGIAGFVAKNQLYCIIKLIRFYFDILLTKYLLRVKIVWTINNLYSHEFKYPKIEKLGRRIFAKQVDAIICHCSKAKLLIQREFSVLPKKIYPIPMGNYKDYYKNEIERVSARNKLNISDELVFLHFGRIKKYKGIENLIESFKEVKSKEQIRLYIVGSLSYSQYGEELLRLAKGYSNIFFEFKFIPDDKIQIYMNAADLIVTPYRNILNSGEIILALGFGKPIIAPRLGCVEELINNQGAILYNSKNINGLKESLINAITRKDALKKMGEYNLNLGNALDWKKVGKDTKLVYIKLLK